MKATPHPLQDPVLEADTLIAQERWDSRRAALFEGPSVTVLVSPRRGARPGTSDAWVTVVVTSDPHCPLEGVAITLEGPAEGRYGRLDRHGRCLFRDVLDASYRLGLCRVAELERAGDPPVTLALPAERLGDRARWTSAGGGVTVTRLSDYWRRVRVDANGPGQPRQLSIGRVVDGHLELRPVCAGRTRGSSGTAATLEFESAGPPDAVCLPAPG